MEPIAVILDQLSVGLILLDLQFVQREVNGSSLVPRPANDAVHVVNHRFIGIAKTYHSNLDRPAGERPCLRGVLAITGSSVTVRYGLSLCILSLYGKWR